MNRKQQLTMLDKQLAHWEATDKEHKAYLKAHPAKPLTDWELKELEAYQRMTHDPKWWG